MQFKADLSNPNKPTHVVGIGASAGGLEALEKFFRAVPLDTGLAFVVIQHLSPDFKSLMDELLSRVTRMPIRVIDADMPVEKNCIYLLPPKKDVVIDAEKLVGYDRSPGKQLTMPINVFFRSLGVAWGERAVGVVLSGTGTDGTEGLLSIRDCGGLVLVQEPGDAKFDGMPMSAISTGCVDKVAKAEELPEVLLSILKDPLYARNAGLDETVNSELSNHPKMDLIYRVLNDTFSLDFKLYKPSTILRRIQRRAAMSKNGSDLDEYAEALGSTDGELYSLYKDLLIGVTGFFRDPKAFECLQTKVLAEDFNDPNLVHDYRIWVCGCSTGEEAYTIAMLVMEEYERRNITPSFKIFATDVNKEYLELAAEGLYSAQSMEAVPQYFKEKYFTPVGAGSYRVSPVLRKPIIFSEHNLLKNPPFTRMNLVSCRNLLIYLRGEAQTPAISSFNFSLVNNGCLFLGISESLGPVSDDFLVVDRQWKIHRKIREASLTIPVRSVDNTGQLMSFDYNRHRNDSRHALGRLYQILLHKYIHCGVLMSEDLELLQVFGDDPRILALGAKVNHNNATSVLVPELGKHVEALVERLKKDASERNCQRTVQLAGQEENIAIDIESIVDKIGGHRTFMAIFRVVYSNKKFAVSETDNPDNPLAKHFSLPIESRQYLIDLQNELKSVKEALQTNAEELETSNEELQASNEELQASNEELQSTNEELHSVNEELYTVNTELELKIVELDRLSSDLKSLVASTQIGSVFLDPNYKIRIFSPLAVEVFSLMEGDVGRDIRDFSPKVLDPNLFNDIASVYAHGQTVEVVVRHRAANDRVYLRVCSPYKNGRGQLEGVVVVYVDLSDLRKRGSALVWQGLKALFKRIK
ncbi:chemotaxis protein CheB [Limnobacter sp.]|uniref:chemotaxis protein CheB n=1 Tax=Limnobacter sp. TaxID=2003368 RepID=UPI003515ED99